MLGCTSTAPAPPGPTTTPPLEPICNAATSWSAGGVAFADVTDAWGLRELEVHGTRLSAVDFDGDGWTDLVVRRGGSQPDDFSDPPACCADASCDETTTCPVRRVWLLRNTGTGGFEDVTLASGILGNRVETDPNLGRPGGVYAFGDVDNDGDLDVYTGLQSNPDETQETSELLLNQGDGTFVLGVAENELRRAPFDVPSGAAFVDYDRNGALDLWVTENSYSNQPQQDRLYWGDVTGMFYDATESAGLITEPWGGIGPLNEGVSHTSGWSALACDLNGDGNPELLASSYGRSPNHLWQGQSDFTYLNRSVASGYAFDHRVDWSDNESARCHCKLHPTDEDCAGVPEPMYTQCESDDDILRWNHSFDREPFRLGGNSGATMCGDVDNDGDMDLLTSEIVHWDVGTSSDPAELLFNNGASDVTFERPGNETTGLVREHAIVAWNDGDITGALFDFDNDGWLDVLIGSTDYPETKALLFHQTSAGKFEAVPFSDGIEHNRSHGSAVADFDRDGDLDIVLGHSRARCGGSTDCYDTPQARMFENVMAQDGNWLQVRLVGTGGSNRAAIGARVTVAGDDGTTQTQEVGGGHGHYGAQHDLTLHFGLGGACRADVTVRWPDASLTTETHELVSGYRFEIEQGGQPEVVSVDDAAE